MEGRENDENIKQDFKMYECKEECGIGTWVLCHDMDAYILTTLLEEYESIWEYEGPLHFYADVPNGKERNPETMEYQAKISSLKDSMGVSISFSDTFEEELIKRIEKVTNSYHLRLVIRGR